MEAELIPAACAGRMQVSPHSSPVGDDLTGESTPDSTSSRVDTMPRIVLALWRSAFPRVILRHTTHVRKGTCEHVAQMCEDASERVAVAWAFGGGHTPPPCVLRRADRLDVTDEQIFSEITKQALRQIHLYGGVEMA